MGLLDFSMTTTTTTIFICDNRTECQQNVKNGIIDIEILNVEWRALKIWLRVIQGH